MSAPIVSQRLWALIEKGTNFKDEDGNNIISRDQILAPPLQEMDRRDNPKIIVQWSITLDQFKAIGKGSGRAGIIPFFYQNEQPYYLLNISNPSEKNRKKGAKELLSDFGGGIQSHETMYDGFVRELDEEIPKWKDELIRCIEDNFHLIHCIETIYVDQTAEPQGFLRHQILVVCQVDPSRLLHDEKDDKVSNEVKRLELKSKSELLSFIMDRSNHDKINSGLHQFKRIVYYL